MCKYIGPHVTIFKSIPSRSAGYCRIWNLGLKPPDMMVVYCPRAKARGYLKIYKPIKNN